MDLPLAAFGALAFFGHGALWVEIVNRVHGLGWRRWIVDAVTVACAAAFFAIPVAAVWSLSTAGANATPWPVTAYAWASLATLLAVVVSRLALRWDPERLIPTPTAPSETLDLATRLGDAATDSPFVQRVARLPGNQLLHPVVERLTLPLSRLPEACDGLRVAHLTDLHLSGRLSIDYFRQVFDVVNAWRPHLVCVTGDIVEHAPQLDWVAPLFGSLDPLVASCFVLGNHDEKIDSDEMRRRLTEAGMLDVGAGVIERIPIESAEIRLCGDERPWFGGEPALSDRDAFTLCLAHTPDRFGWAASRGVDLVLAGHCHGGQVCFPVIGPLLCPSRHGVRYAAGTFRRDETVMHVGRGTGSLFPARYRCPPEVALLTLARG